jgi:hypothetical protein
MAKESKENLTPMDFWMSRKSYTTYSSLAINPKSSKEKKGGEDFHTCASKRTTQGSRYPGSEKFPDVLQLLRNAFL